jgi:TonB-linked SusC/RagA family outer membrane protein
MKKNHNYYGVLIPFSNWRKLLLTMKISTVLMFCCLANILAGPSYSQTAKVSLDLRNVTVEEVLNKIEDESEFFFLFNEKLVDLSKKVDIKADEQPIKDILDYILGESIKYSVFDRQIILFPEDMTVSEAAMQQPVVTGKVVDAQTGEPLVGATIMVKGTNIGAFTSIEGDFSVNVPDLNATIVVVFIGYKTQEITLTGNARVDVSLEQDVQKLDEIVVIGYGVASRRAVTGSVVKVPPASLVQNTSQNVGVALQGRVSGVQITQNSGNPEADINIRIRGVSSIYQGSKPLLVVDGVVGGLELNELNMNDIASIEVLKDASAGAIYGSRAANGVILVTTKAGNRDKGKASIEYSHGINSITNWVPVAETWEYLTIMDRAWQNSQADRAGQFFTQFPISGLDGFDRTIAEANNTNWKDIVTQPAYYDQVDFNVSGGNEKTLFYLSGQYRDESGYDAGLRIRRAIARLNIDHEINKYISVGAKINMTYSFRNNAYASFGDYYDKLLPIYPVMTPSTLPERAGRYFYDRTASGGQGINPLYKRDETFSDQRQLRDVTSAYLEIKPIAGLNLRSEWGMRYNPSRNRSYQSRDYMRKGDGIDLNQEGSIGYSRYENFRFTGTNTLTYNKAFGAHDVNIMAGNSIEGFSMDGQSNTYEGFPTDYFTLTNANTSIVSTRQSVSVDQYRFLSYFGRARYDYKKRYFAEYNFRADYSSRFGPDHRWGQFHGAAFSWIITEENFMKNLPVLNYAKLRVSLGQTGNAEMENFRYNSAVVNWGTYGGQPGFLFDKIGNKKIGWEKTTQFNAGLDYSILKDRISGTFEVFNKDVTDLIVQSNIGQFHGYYTQPIPYNLGGLTNKGFDISVSTRNLTGRFKWTTDFNISRSKSTVTKLVYEQRYIQSNNNMVVIGYPLGAYFLPVFAGVDPITGHEMIYGVDPKAEATRAPLMSDLSGEVIDLERYTNTGSHAVLLEDKSPYPDFYGGLTNTFSFKGFELSATLSFQYGNYIYGQGIQNLMYTSTDKNVSPDLLNGWTAAKPTNVPLIYGTRANVATTRFLYDGSYARLKNVQLSYSLPKNLLNKINFNGGILLKAGGQNLLTFTKYPGIDPEFFSATDNLSSNLSPGIDGFKNPQVRTFFFSVNLTF